MIDLRQQLHALSEKMRGEVARIAKEFKKHAVPSVQVELWADELDALVRAASPPEPPRERRKVPMRPPTAAIREMDAEEAERAAGGAAGPQEPPLHDGILKFLEMVAADAGNLVWRRRVANELIAKLRSGDAARVPPSPLREKFCEAHLKELLYPGWHYNYEEGDAPKRLSADGIGGCAICKGERLEMEVGTLRGLRAAHAPPAPPPPQGWQPMTSAPQDGTLFIGVNADGGVLRARWCNRFEPQTWATEEGFYAHDLVGWMPLPDPPATPPQEQP